MNEVKEVLRLWLEGQGKRWIGRRVGLDPKTVRGYIEAAERVGVTVEQGVAGLTDERFAAVMADLQPESGRPRGDAWALCESQREKIARHLLGKVKLTIIARDPQDFGMLEDRSVRLHGCFCVAIEPQEWCDFCRMVFLPSQSVAVVASRLRREIRALYFAPGVVRRVSMDRNAPRYAHAR